MSYRIFSLDIDGISFSARSPYTKRNIHKATKYCRSDDGEECVDSKNTGQSTDDFTYDRIRKHHIWPRTHRSSKKRWTRPDDHADSPYDHDSQDDLERLPEAVDRRTIGQGAERWSIDHLPSEQEDYERNDP